VIPVALVDDQAIVRAGVARIRHQRGLQDPPTILVLTTFGEDEVLWVAVEAGAAGFMLKDSSAEDLIAAVRAVAGGAAWFDPGVAPRLLDRYRRVVAPAARDSGRLDLRVTLGRMWRTVGAATRWIFASGFPARNRVLRATLPLSASKQTELTSIRRSASPSVLFSRSRSSLHVASVAARIRNPPRRRSKDHLRNRKAPGTASSTTPGATSGAKPSRKRFARIGRQPGNRRITGLGGSAGHLVGQCCSRDATVLLDAGPWPGSHRVAWAEMVLREQQMPPDELHIVVSSSDRELVRRHLDLHLERLDEWLASHKRRLREVGRILAEPGDRYQLPAGSRGAR
jgi:hypothetical protein